MTHCIAVRQHPHEIREVTVPSMAVRAWMSRMHRDGWTALALRRVG